MEETEGQDQLDDTGDTGEDTTEELPGEPGGDGSQPGGQAPVAKPVTFTQEQVNSFLANERRKWAASQRETPGRVVQPVPTRETPGPSSRKFDDETLAALREYIDPIVTPLREQAVQGDIERATAAVKAAHPELSDQKNMDAVINLVLSWGEPLVNSAPMNWLLEQGYAAWHTAQMNDPVYKQKIVDEYVASKAANARKTPPPQGSGGRATTSQKPKQKPNPKDWGSADAAMKELIQEANAAE